jgi:hypothetical protein
MLLETFARALRSRATFVTLLFTAGALTSSPGLPAFPATTEKHSDIAARIATIRTVLRDQEVPPPERAEPPNRTMQWSNWGNWPNWNNWRNWNNWLNWNNWGNY